MYLPRLLQEILAEHASHGQVSFLGFGQRIGANKLHNLLQLPFSLQQRPGPLALSGPIFSHLVIKPGV